MELQIYWNTVNGSDGSATCTMFQNSNNNNNCKDNNNNNESTTVIGSVMGPGPVKPKQESFEEASVEVDLAFINSPSSITTNVLSFQIKEMVLAHIIKEMNPRSLIKIALQVITPFLNETDEAGIRVVAFNAAMCALISAGIPLKGIPIAYLTAVDVAGGCGGAIETVYEYREQNINGRLVYQNIMCAPTSIDILKSSLANAEESSSRIYESLLLSLEKEYR